MTDLLPLTADLARKSLTTPREAARRVIAIGRSFQPAELWLVLFLLAVVSTILSHLVLMTLPPVDAGDGFVWLDLGPVALAGLQLATMAVMVWAILLVGGRMGGRGDLAGALSVVVWLEFLTLAPLLAQAVLAPLAPALCDVAGMLGMAAFWVLLSFFVAELHGFRSVPMVFGGIVLTVLILAFALTPLLFLAGVRLDV
ncbi:MAG: hypothetical protein QM656_05720 [Paracoccaceae bacterium]